MNYKPALISNILNPFEDTNVLYTKFLVSSLKDVLIQLNIIFPSVSTFTNDLAFYGDAMIKLIA